MHGYDTSCSAISALSGVSQLLLNPRMSHAFCFLLRHRAPAATLPASSRLWRGAWRRCCSPSPPSTSGCWSGTCSAGSSCGGSGGGGGGMRGGDAEQGSEAA